MDPVRNSVTLLHLSDLQFGRNHRFGNLGATAEDGAFDTLLERLRIDLDDLKRDHRVVPEAIVVTGDLAEWGMKAEFDDAFVLLDELSRHLGIPREHVAMIPGNHDLNWKTCQSYFLAQEGEGEKPERPYWPKWKQYVGMFQEFYRGVAGVQFREELPWTLWQMPELRMVVAGLNSTMHESHEEGTHYGFVGEAQLRWFKGELDKYSRDEWVVLGLVHHNVVRGLTADDENLRDADDLSRILGPSLDLLLHGHTHNAKSERLGDLRVLSTGSAGLALEQRPPEVQDQYQILRLSARAIERWARCYHSKKHQWIGDTSVCDNGNNWITKEKVTLKAFATAPKARVKKVEDPSRYVAAMRAECAEFDVQGLKFGDNKVYRFSIEEFYIPLGTSAGGDSTRLRKADRGGAGELQWEGDGPKQAGQSPSEVVAHSAFVNLEEVLRRERKLFVVGDPGAGKSTFLKRVAFELCKGYESGGPLPVRIEAAVFSKFIELQIERKLGPADPKSPEWLPLFLGAQCAGKNLGLSAEYFASSLKAGRCQVLIDGMDETPDEATRERLVRVIREAAAAFEGCKFVVTSRPEGKVPIAGFEEALIADLEPKAITEFLEKLSRQLYPTDEAKEQEFREDLEKAVNGRREIRRMTRNPVMLTALVVLQHNNVKLPEKRVDLYGSILGWLSKQRPKDGRKPADECLRLLRELALAMQNHPDGRQKQVPLAWAGDQLKGHFADLYAAEKFLRDEMADSGIVVSRGKDLAFWHLTFQEYLAAEEIAGWEDSEQYRLLLPDQPKIYLPEWRECVLLYGGLLFNIGPKKVDGALRRFLDGMGKNPGLAQRAQCVGLIGALLPDLDGYVVADARYQESLDLVMGIFDAEKAKGVPFKDRLAAAEALGQAGDPRLTEKELVGNGRIFIPESKGYWLGAQREDPKGRNYDELALDREKLRKVDLPKFWLAKYPVTVAEYLRYLEEGHGKGQEPEDWEEQQAYQNSPVVGVSWKQAKDYAKWAGARLPSEAEWERGARGPERLIYPWGKKFDSSLANTRESGPGRRTPVGLYPAGASAEGLLDMAGNVWEWTASEYPGVKGAYVIRGGSFVYGLELARSAFRYDYQAGAQGRNLGFRLAGGIP